MRNLKKSIKSHLESIGEQYDSLSKYQIIIENAKDEIKYLDDHHTYHNREMERT